MSNNRPLVPPFLNRFDQYLLLNKPEAWSARTHLVVYFGGLFIAALALISFVIPNDPRSYSPSFYWIGFVVIISIIAFTGWLIYLLRFNVFKRYGNSTPLSRLATFILYFISVGIIALFPMVMPFVETIRANRAYTDQEIANDINAINTKICQLEYDSLSHRLKSDTIRVVNQLPVYQSMPAEDTLVMTDLPRQNRYRLVDTASLAGSISAADSSARLNDSTWIFYESKKYTFISSYTASYYAQSKVYSDYELYQKVIRDFHQPDRRTVRSELYRLLDKYKSAESTLTANTYYSDEGDEDIYQKIGEKYRLDGVNRSVDNVVARKYRWRKDNTAVVTRIWFYTTLIFTLLVFLYRHSTRKTFFLSVLTSIILTIITAIFTVYLTVQESSYFGWMIAYILLFFVVSLFSFKTKVRNVVTGIGINLFVFVIVLLPLCIVSYYYAIKREREFILLMREETDYEAMRLHILYAEIAGLLLLLILLATYIPRVYRKWYALPEE